MKFWQSSSECKRCGIALNDDLSVEERRDDLIKKSSLITTTNMAGPLCASCRIVHNSSEFAVAPFDKQSIGSASISHESDGNHITISKIMNWMSARLWNLLTWAIIIIIALFKFSGITGWFDDEQPTEVFEVITIEEQLDIPTKILDGDNAVVFNSPAEWVVPNDYPSKALRNEREGTTLFELIVSEQGEVSECIVTESSGHSDLDEATCRAIKKRANFYKGLDENGNPIKSKYRNRVRWQIPE